MTIDDTMPTVKKHWERIGLGKAILDDLSSLGKDLDSLTTDDLAPYDQFHGGGKEMTLRLARDASLQPGMRVLDVGGGLGGPARTLAIEYGCHVTVADLTESYLEAGRMLTERLNLTSQVEFVLSDALELPFNGESFDVVWTQNGCMNIRDKHRLYCEFRRVLTPDGLLLFQEPMAGAVQPPIYPLMWAPDASTNFLLTSDEMKRVIESAGFVVHDWQDLTGELVKLRTGSESTSHNIQAMVMGARLDQIRRASKRNIEEHRTIMVQGAARRTTP
ncbi:MAG: methyltransferase domain-containing protein [Candidatus Zixiibacteriota bacterium]